MVIYKTTNLVNGKIYVGKQKVSQDEYLGSGLILRHAINKYGRDKFKKIILEECDSIDELNEREKYWIKQLCSTDLNIGYNIMSGGDGGDNFTNHPNKEEIRKKCSKKGEKNGMFGRNHTEDSIKRISKNKKGQRKGLPTWNKGKSIKGYSENYAKYHKRLNGSGNPNANMFIFTSPAGIEHKVIGNFKGFCDDQNINVNTARVYINGGVIPAPKKGKMLENRVNIIGWKITKDKVVILS